MKKKIINGLKYWGQLLLLPVYWLSFLVPGNKNIWVFGSTFGRRFADNPRYFYLYVSQHSAYQSDKLAQRVDAWKKEGHEWKADEDCLTIRAVWISHNKEIVSFLQSNGYEAYYYHSLKGIWMALRAGVYLFDNYSKDINFWQSGRALKVNMWHGIPLKKIQADNRFDLFRHPKNSWEKFKCFPRNLSDEKPSHYVLTTSEFMRPIFSVGLASALATALGNASNMVMLRLASGYGDIPVAAYGIVKRIDQFPLNVSMGLCQGFMPLVGYNFAAKNYNRMRQVSVFSWKTALVMSACFVACFTILAPQILHIFIPEEQTSTLGATFLRIACLAVPLTSVNFLISYTLQAMGKGIQSAILTFSRQGLLNIPLLILMNIIFGLYGMIWTQLVVEVIMLPVSLGMYIHTFRGLQAGNDKQ